MRAIQLGSSSEAQTQESSITDSVSRLTETWERARDSAVTGRSSEDRERESDGANLDLAIAGLSLLLAIVAWQRDASKSRRELVDAALFGTLGILERYVSIRDR